MKLNIDPELKEALFELLDFRVLRNDIQSTLNKLAEEHDEHVMKRINHLLTKEEDRLMSKLDRFATRNEVE